MKTIKNKAVIYARVSSKEQEETGYSLSSQKDYLLDYSERKDFKIIKTFSISESASGKNQREVFMKMMKYMSKNNIKVLICEKVDRLTRNFRDAIVIDDWLEDDEDKQVHLVKDSLVLHKNSRSQEKLNWGVRILFAKNYTDNLSEEVKKGQKQKIKEGWYPTKPPLGYKTTGEKGKKIHIIDKDVGPYIKKMFNLYATGNYSIKALSDKMFKLGFKSRNNIQVVKGRVHKMLSDPFYYGKFVWKGKMYQGNQEPIISKDLFEEVGFRLNGGNPHPYFRKRMTEFRGKILCDKCKKTITWEYQKGNWYGGCKQCKSQLSKDKKYIRRKDVEEDLMKRITTIAPKNDRILKILEKALKESHLEESEYHETKVKGMNNKLERIRQRVKTMYNDKLDERITAEFYDEKLKEFESEREDLTDALKRLDSDNSAYYRAGFGIHELAMRSNQIYLSSKASIEERRLLLSYAFSNIYILQGNIRVKYTKAFQFLQEWLPKVNEVLEPEKCVDNKRQKSTFVPLCPTMLTWRDAFRDYEWNKAFPDPEYAVKEMNKLLALV